MRTQDTIFFIVIHATGIQLNDKLNFQNFFGNIKIFECNWKTNMKLFPQICPTHAFYLIKYCFQRALLLLEIIRIIFVQFN